MYAARAANLYFPGGRCPGVGVAGLTLGGGLGFNDRKWGMTCDRLLSTRVVLADGSVVRASERENADLFWACRGGAGGNFGINTGFTFDAVPVGELRATVFDLTFGLDAGVRVMAELQDALRADVAGDFDVRVGFSHPGSGAPVLNVLGQRLGTEDELRRALAGVLDLEMDRLVIEERQFWAAQDFLMAAPEVGAMASKSLVPDRWLEPHTVESVIGWVRDWRPGPSGGTGYITLFAMGVRSDAPGPGETAFPHRDATFVIDIGAHWKAGTPDGEAAELVNQTRAAHHTLSRQLGTDAAYVNFPDPDLRPWRSAYYGANYRRLTEVKRRYDPTGLFRYAQGIEAAPAACALSGSPVPRSAPAGVADCSDPFVHRPFQDTEQTFRATHVVTVGASAAVMTRSALGGTRLCYVFTSPPRIWHASRSPRNSIRYGRRCSACSSCTVRGGAHLSSAPGAAAPSTWSHNGN